MAKSCECESYPLWQAFSTTAFPLTFLLVAAERQRGVGELKRVKLESKDAKGKLEDAQELADDLYRSEDAKMSEIDTLKAHIKELEMERGYVYK